MHVPKEKRRKLDAKEKGRKKIAEYDTSRNESDRCAKKNKNGPSETKSESAKRALKSANEKLH